jgi:hypothetical protein
LGDILKPRVVHYSTATWYTFTPANTIEENESMTFSMRCRIYHTETGLSGVPPKHLIQDALLKQSKRIRVNPTNIIIEIEVLFSFATGTW